MDKCKRCGSKAINHNLHDRAGDDDDLCDVCYWRKRYEKAEAEVQKVLCEQREATFQAIMEEINFDQELYDELHTIARNSKV